jgi:dipeptidyl-peptidase-3
MRRVVKNGQHELEIDDFQELRGRIAQLLAEIQRIKSEGDFEAARQLVETYAVNVDSDLHAEVLERYKKLNLAPYKGFINPQLIPVLDDNGDICDITVSYSESYVHQMLRYGQEYGTL